MNNTSIAQKGFFAYLIGKKTLMALTGLFLTLFLTVHVSGNLQLFKNDQGKAFNEYSVFMTTFPPVKAISYLLYLSIVAHAIDALILTLANKKARPKAYAVNNPSKNSTWSSRNMGLLGTVLLFFLIIHLSDFWFEYKFGHIPYTQYNTNIMTGETTAVPFDGTIDGKMQEYVVDGQTKVVIVKDLYAEVAEAFKNPLISIIYVVCMIAVAFHLHHGFHSSFQSLGINHPKYTPLIKKTGTIVFAIIIPALFAAMPLYFLIN
jgi:succinate dehydrogenase / fumarate reductase, cytochrome b subunit